MSSNYEGKNDHELLLELVESQKQATKNGRITAIVDTVLLIVLVVSLGITLPKMLTTLDHAEKTMTRIDELAVQADESLDEIDEMVVNINDLVEENAEDIASAIDGIDESASKLQKIDIDKLNNSIEAFDNTVSAFSKITSFLR